MLNRDNIYAASDFTYTIKGNLATITAYKGTSENVVIPNKIDNYKVIAIGNHAFDDSRNSTNGKKMINVVISEGITTIGDFAFIGCTNLVNLKLPQSLTSLGDQTFIGCTNLKKINIPPKVTNLGITGYMFQECGLESIIIPANVTNIPVGTFRICTQLKKVIIYSPKATIDLDAFEHCSDSLVIQGYKSSTAQTFATQNGFKFVPITNQGTNTNNSKQNNNTTNNTTNNANNTNNTTNNTTTNNNTTDNNTSNNVNNTNGDSNNINDRNNIDTSPKPNITFDSLSETNKPDSGQNGQGKYKNALDEIIINAIIKNLIFFIPVIIVFLINNVGIIVFIIRNKKKIE